MADTGQLTRLLTDLAVRHDGTPIAHTPRRHSKPDPHQAHLATKEQRHG